MSAVAIIVPSANTLLLLQYINWATKRRFGTYKVQEEGKPCQRGQTQGSRAKANAKQWCKGCHGRVSTNNGICQHKPPVLNRTAHNQYLKLSSIITCMLGNFTSMWICTEVSQRLLVQDDSWVCEDRWQGHEDAWTSIWWNHYIP